MTQLKYYDTTSGTWITAVVGAQGVQGAQGTNAFQVPASSHSTTSASGSLPFATWTFDPALTTQDVVTITSTNGVVYFWQFYLPVDTTVSTVSCNVYTAGSTLTNAYIGIYDMATPSILRGSVALPSTLSTGFNTFTLIATGAGLTLTAGTYQVAICMAATTKPTFWSANSGGTATQTNLGITPVANKLSYRAGHVMSGQTSLPATISGTPATDIFVGWFGIA